jgi:hypothetical protein
VPARLISPQKASPFQLLKTETLASLVRIQSETSITPTFALLKDTADSEIRILTLETNSPVSFKRAYHVVAPYHHFTYNAQQSKGSTNNI